MGCGSEHFAMIFIITTTLLMLLSSQSTHILTLFNAVGRSFQVHGLPEMYFVEDNNEKHVKKISGIDENEQKQAFIVEKFRSLLGLKSFHTKVPSNGDDLEFLSPSPSPSPFTEEAQAPAPSPSPLPHVHPHSHHPQHHKHPPLHKTHHEDRVRAKRILIAVLVSAGVATILIGACGLFFLWRKFSNHAKKPKRTMPLCSKSKESGGAYQSSTNKVSLNSGLDLFYLNALGEDIEQHSCNLKKTCKDGLECDNVSGCSTKEIASVHEDVEESVKGEVESDAGNSSSGDRIIPEDFHSSDNESFHSFVDDSLRLSNASVGSLSDTQSHTHSPHNSISLPNQFPSSPHNSISNIQSHQSPPNSPKHEENEIEKCVQCPKTFTLPPPPPPPPPPPGGASSRRCCRRRRSKRREGS